MRPVYLAIPASLAFATAGLALMVAARAPKAIAVSGADPFNGPAGTVRHLVTPIMTTETAKRTEALLPTIWTQDSEGKPLVLASRAAARPQFVYFVLDGCPCSYDADPLFKKLFKRYQGKIDFVAVTNGDRKQAHEWSVQLLEPYPVVPDPQKKIIRAYEARSSVYSTLIDRDGHVIKMWPGYSAGLLKDMNATMARAVSVAVKPFDTEYAPQVKATGCAF